MKRLTLFLVLFGATLGLFAADERISWPIKPSPDGRFLVDSSGAPFFLHADTGWLLTKKLTLAETKEYLDNRKAKGFNTIFIHAISKERGPAANREGQDPFIPLDEILKPNEPYWRHLDSIMQAAQSRNLLIGMSAIWIQWGGKDPEGWRYQLNEDNARSYGRFLGRRYGGFKNLFWFLGGDANPMERTRTISELASGIREFTPHQILTVHNRPENASSAYFESEPWLGINLAYTYRETYLHLLGEYNRLTRPRPIVLGESGYEDESNDRRGGEPFRARRQAYGAILSGALGGHAFGNKHLWQMDSEWRSAMESPASKQMVHVKTLFASRAWYTLVPDQFDEFVVGGRGNFNDVDYVTAAVSADRDFAIVYLPVSRPVVVNLDRLKPGLRARWFDPTDGSYHAIGDVARNGQQIFAPPAKNSVGEGDFVLAFE